MSNNEPVCWMRYSGGGTPYKICKTPAQVKNMKKKAEKSRAKRLKDYLPDITAKEFLDKIDKTYVELTEGQKRQYHKYKQRERRKVLKKLYNTNVDDVKKEYKEERLKRKEEKEQEKKQKKEKKEKKKKIKKKKPPLTGSIKQGKITLDF